MCAIVCSKTEIQNGAQTDISFDNFPLLPQKDPQSLSYVVYGFNSDYIIIFLRVYSILISKITFFLN